MLYCAYTCDYVIFSSFSQASRNFLANFREGARKSLNRAENRGGLGIIRDDSGSIRKVLKTVWGQPHGGSNPSASAKNNCRMGYILQLFFIQVADLVYHHRTKCGGYHQPFGLYIITHQRVFSCDLMRYSPESEIYSFPDG